LSEVKKHLQKIQFSARFSLLFFCRIARLFTSQYAQCFILLVMISSLQFHKGTGTRGAWDLPETITVAHELDLDVSEDSVHKALSNLNVSQVSRT
jgi:hypothetical protein